MKPQFALSLSFEGIRLLHRAAGGWLDVGGVSLASQDIAGELANLRKIAAILEPGGVHTKLIIPNDQIKYLTIDTKGMSRKQRVGAARAALVGATPYKVRDLSFDICPDGPLTHIAAVANETLAEAEGFAAEHRFNPISFVAVPGIETFLGEPFFGPTQNAQNLLPKNATVEADGVAVVIVGTVAASKIDEIVSSHDAQQASTSPENAPDTEDATEALLASPDADPALSEEATAESAETIEALPEPVSEASDPMPPATAATFNAVEQDETLELNDETAAEDAKDDSTGDDATKETAFVPLLEEANTEINVADIPTAEDAAPFVADANMRDLGDQANTDAPADPVPEAIDPVSRSAIPPAPAGFASRRADPEPQPGRMEPTLGAADFIIETFIGPDSSSLDQPEPPQDDERDVSGDTIQTLPFAAHRDASDTANAPQGTFLSRRMALSAPARHLRSTSVPATEAASTAKPANEADRLTVFGARKSKEIGGKPRFLGLILTFVLLVFLAGVAAWATVFLDDGLAGLFNGREKRAVASAPEYQVEPQIIRTTPEPAKDLPTSTPDPSLSEEDTAVLDALSEPELAPPITIISEAEAEARYAVSGIWPLPPTLPQAPPTIPLDDFYLTSIDPVSTSSDAVALPPTRSYATDLELPAIASPAPLGTDFALDAQGLVIPTPEGAVSPDGVIVYLGKPPVMPPQTPNRVPSEPEVDPESTALAGLRPRDRPENLAEANERAQLDGLTRNELADFRPRLRPDSVQKAAENAAAQRAAISAAAEAAAASLDTAQESGPDQPAQSPFGSATQLAVVQSVRPDVRPDNFNRVVQRAQRETPQVTQTSARSLAPSTVAPQIPSSTSVAKQATMSNALNLRKVNLIGVYGKPSSRRALVRLGNGRYQKVVVGDRIDGGRVSAIGDSELRYTKGGRALVLKMPQG